MFFNKLQLNNFGKFSNKEIELDKNINIIKGNNESGKSTMQKFIISMIYGISKDKRKSSFTDYDKYYPWGKENFSGKISYSLDDGKTYEVYRDFTKKNPIIYNEQAEDITDLYKKTTKGSTFFEEQTGVDEKTMTSSMVTEQASVVIDQTSQNFVIQKIANMAETGDERISYDNAQKYLTKKRNEEVGTDKTKNRPINNLYKEKHELINEKVELESFTGEQYEINEKIKNVLKQKEKNERLLEFAKRYKNIIDQEIEFNNKITIYNDSLNENERQKEFVLKQKMEIEKKLTIEEEKLDNDIRLQEKRDSEKKLEIEILNKNKEKKNKILIAVSIVLIVLGLVLMFINLIPVSIVLGVIAIVFLLVRRQSVKKVQKIIDEKMAENVQNTFEEQKIEIEKIRNQLKECDLKLDVLKKNSEDIRSNIEKINYQIKENESQSLRKLVSEFEDLSESEYLEILNKDKIEDKIEILQNLKNDSEIEIQKYEYRKKYIIPKIERLAEVEEKIYEVDEKEQELQKEADAILIASNILKEAYEEMKENVAPKFTEDLSNAISHISNNKYSKVLTNDKEGIIVEKETGEYVSAKALSMGTIDQLYLSLRFAITKEASNQVMPIILDEPFAFYDRERLSNILKYISEKFANNQILLFTCTSREVEILSELNIKFNLIEL
ncbi:MAG: AAA family ATPase [Clostridia bacterium]|nr:AAA family ATPase [Bacilli bacterium]MBR3324792.1 AAA family ATPase [Clostridia bacterium]